MFKLKSESTWETSHGTAYAIASPVACERSFAAFREAIGPEIEIDGKIVAVVGSSLGSLFHVKHR